MVAAQDIKVESYSKTAFKGSWVGRSRAMWAVSFLGLVTGLAIGLIAPFFPVLAVGAFTAEMAAANVLGSMAIFGASGMATGFIVGGFIGGASGGVSEAAREAERRDLVRTKAIEQATGLQIPEVNVAQNKPEQKYFNPKVGLLFATFGAIAGGIMAAAFVFSGAGAAAAAIPALSTLTHGVVGAAAIQSAQTACFVGVMTCFGALFGINYPKISYALQDYAGKLLGGDLLGSSWDKEPARGIDITIERQPSLAAAQQPMQQYVYCDERDLPTNHAVKEARRSITSYRDFVAQPAQENELAFNNR